ncbi:MAG: hypothetical protein Q9190_004288 [Brigantiaea leucoxantha]
MFGLKAHQIEEASSVLRIVATDWRELLVGSEGFLVGKGRAGLEKHQVVWGEMRVAARCVEDIVVYDYKHANKIPLRPFMLDQFKATWDAQEHTKSKNEFQVEQLVKQVRKLEKESWDKEGAQEDLGGT